MYGVDCCAVLLQTFYSLYLFRDNNEQINNILIKYNNIADRIKIMYI